MPAPSSEIRIESDPSLAILKRKYDFADISSVSPPISTKPWFSLSAIGRDSSSIDAGVIRNGWAPARARARCGACRKCRRLLRVCGSDSGGGCGGEAGARSRAVVLFPPPDQQTMLLLTVRVGGMSKSDA